MNSVSDLVFWPACVRFRPFREHVEAAVAGGFTSMAIAAETYYEAIGSGLSAADIKAMAEDAGVPVRHYDTLTGWAPIRVPEGAGAAMRARFDVPIEDALEICDALGLITILAVAGYPPDSLPFDTLVTGFADLCDRAAKMGIWVDLEFMPLLGLPTLADAWAIVSSAQRPNSGIMIDSWHLSKSDLNLDLDLLQALPPAHIQSAQLADGFREMRGADMVEDTLFHRAFPGEGEFPMLEILEILHAKGSLRRIGAEIFSHAANAMSAQEAGRRCGETTRAMLDRAAIVYPVPS